MLQPFKREEKARGKKDGDFNSIGSIGRFG